MTLHELKRRLAYEARTSPKKVAALAALALVGGYFWAPLIFKGAKKSPPPAPAAASCVAQERAASPTAAASSRRARDDAPDWQACAEWLQGRAETGADFQALARNPFVRKQETSKPESSVAAAPQVVEKAPEVESPPAPPKGLILGSTVVGEQQRLALINGRVYREGMALSDGAATYVLTKVLKGKVVLSAKGRDFDLTIPEPRPTALVGDGRSAGEIP